MSHLKLKYTPRGGRHASRISGIFLPTGASAGITPPKPKGTPRGGRHASRLQWRP